MSVLASTLRAGVLLASAIAAAVPAAAEIIRSGDGGFELRAVRTVATDRPASYAASIRDVGRWWNPDHTYSGRASNLRIEPRAGGCFCEKTGDRGGVQHMQVVYLAPGKALRLAGGLGPLQALAASGALTWSFEDAAGGGPRIAWSYRVNGLSAAESASLAPVVDQVLTEQLERLARHLGGGKP